MDNSPNKTGYNTELERVERLARMEVRTTEPYSPCQNKYESVIKITKGKYNRRRVHRNIHKRIWNFGMIWRTEIYSRTAVKDGRPAPERLTGDTLDISEGM